MSFTVVAVSANDPKAMTLSRMVRGFPFRRLHRAFANLDNQIANGESSFFGHYHEINMRPLRLVVIHHVTYLREQQTVWLQDPFCFFQKVRIVVTKVPVLFFAAFNCCPKIYVEPFYALISALWPNVWRIEDYSSEVERRYTYHFPIVTKIGWIVSWVDIHRYHVTL